VVGVASSAATAALLGCTLAIATIALCFCLDLS
jgi:hypothetical protein